MSLLLYTAPFCPAKTPCKARRACMQGTMLHHSTVQLPAFIQSQLTDEQPVRLLLDDYDHIRLMKPWDAYVEQGYIDFKPVDPSDIAVLSAMDHGLNASSTTELQQLGKQARPVIDQALQETGAVLLRGLLITNPEACEAFVDGLDYTHMSYQPFLGVRKKVGKLDAATNVDPSQLLDLHNEMVYNPRPANKVFLICLKPAEQGGESLIGDGKAITAAIPDHIIQKFADKGGIKYTRTYPSAAAAAAGPAVASSGFSMPTWQERTGFEDKEKAAAFFQDLGCTTEWTGPEHDTLVAYNIQPAIITHPRVPSMQLWFNLVHLTVTYGDGSKVEDDVLDEINAARTAATKVLRLQAGDVLALDNYRYLHGRLPYKGDQRLMVTVLTSD